MKKSLITAGLCVALASFVAMPATSHADPAAPDMSDKLVGKTIFLDPGHQGTNHSENLSRPVDDGRGGTKECQTTGMTSMNGVPEHTINWKVSELVKTSLESLGAKVVLSRADDSGWGGCVDERAKAANASGANLAVSIHADGAPAADHGFHLIIPQLPIPLAAANAAQSKDGLAASKAIRDAYVKSGFSPANYAGAVDGLQTRSDVAGPALTTVPLAFVEMGNGANKDDAALLEGGEGQLKHAIAITTGIVTYLLGPNPGTTVVRGTPPDTTATEPDATESDTTAPSTKPKTTKPKTTKPKTTKPGTAKPKASTPDSALTDSVVDMLQPLLGALGIPGADAIVNPTTVGLAGDLASQLLDLGIGALSKAGN